MKILVFEDDTSMASTLRQLYINLDVDVQSTRSIIDGIRKIQAEKIDIILIDITHSNSSSEDLCKQIRSFSRVPILILSPLDSPGMIAETLDAGADDYLIRPVSSRVLMVHIDKLIRRSIYFQNQNNDFESGSQTEISGA